MNALDRIHFAAALRSAAFVATLLLGQAAVALAATPSAAQAPAPAAAAAESRGRVDVNSASAAELEALPGIGASKAAAIVAEREKKPFSSVDDLARVKGIGERTLDDLRDKVSVGTH